MLTGLLGSGSAVLVAGVAWLFAKYRHHLPGRHTGQWVLTAAVIVMILAGFLAGFMGVGHWTISLIRDLETTLGPSGRVILVLAGLAMLILVTVAVFRTATDAAMWIAFTFPLISLAINRGMFASINQTFKPYADQFQAMLRAKLGA